MYVPVQWSAWRPETLTSGLVAWLMNSDLQGLPDGSEVTNWEVKGYGFGSGTRFAYAVARNSSAPYPKWVNSSTDTVNGVQGFLRLGPGAQMRLDVDFVSNPPRGHTMLALVRIPRGAQAGEAIKSYAGTWRAPFWYNSAIGRVVSDTAYGASGALGPGGNPTVKNDWTVWSYYYRCVR